MKTDFVEIFQTIRAVLQPYTISGFTAINNTETAFDLVTEKAIDMAGKKDQIYFAGVKIEDNGVGFYFKPIADNEELKNLVSTELLALLDDGSCFYIKELDDSLLEKISETLAVGATYFKQQEWA